MTDQLADRLANISGDALRFALRHALMNQATKAKGLAKRGRSKSLTETQKMYRELDIIVKTAELRDKFS